MNISRTLYKWLGLALSVSFLFSACKSLESDITPPPTESELVSLPATPLPTQELPQTEATLASEELEGEVIVVTVVDQTGGTLMEQGLVVELAGFDEFNLVYEDTQALIEGDTVIFRDAPFLAGRVFLASISYGGAIYRSEIVEIGAETTQLNFTIQIFETTTSDEFLIIDRVHLLADIASQETIQIVEIFIVSNLGNTTVVAENPSLPTISFPLPAGAESIEFENGELGLRYLITNDGFGDTVSIPPGAGVYQVLVYYSLPLQRNKINFSQVMNYPVQAVTVMTPAGEAIVKGSSLEDRGIQAIPDGSVQIYSGAGLARGETLEFKLTVESDIFTLLGGGTDFLSRGVIIGVGVLGGVILLIGLWLFMRRRSQDLAQDEGQSTGKRSEQILDSIIALDDLYQEGEIGEKEYSKKRQELKDKLAALEDEKI